MSGLEIVRVSEVDIDRLREIRLESLNRHPEAFSADPDVWAAFPLERWLGFLKTSAWFAATADREWLGLAAFRHEDGSKKTKHMGSLGAMYVRQAHRGAGVADALIEAVLEHAAGEVEQVQLTVNADNKPAIRLYERHGFRTYGRLPRALKIDGKFYDEIEMIRSVSASD